jgi:hypothetical protein
MAVDKPEAVSEVNRPEDGFMLPRAPRFRLSTLMIAFIVIALGLWIIELSNRAHQYRRIAHAYDGYLHEAKLRASQARMDEIKLWSVIHHQVDNGEIKQRKQAARKIADRIGRFERLKRFYEEAADHPWRSVPLPPE